MATPTITIVTAVHNRAATIADAMKSVQGQRGVDVEHVVVDGASTDGTVETIRAMIGPGTRFASEPDGGIYDALNKGIRRASGEVIGILHSDDVFAGPDVLATVRARFEDPEVDAVYGDLEYVSARDTTRVIRHWVSGEFTPERLARGWMPPHPTLFLRRQVFDRDGLYDTSYRIAGDYDAVLRYFARPGFRAVYVPEVLVRMRVGGASNGSLRQILRKSAEDYRALRLNGIGGATALLRKKAGKLGQFHGHRGSGTP